MIGDLDIALYRDAITCSRRGQAHTAFSLAAALTLVSSALEKKCCVSLVPSAFLACVFIHSWCLLFTKMKVHYRGGSWYWAVGFLSKVSWYEVREKFTRRWLSQKARLQSPSRNNSGGLCVYACRYAHIRRSVYHVSVPHMEEKGHILGVCSVQEWFLCRMMKSVLDASGCVLLPHLLPDLWGRPAPRVSLCLGKS